MSVIAPIFAQAAIGAVEKGIDFVVNPPDFKKSGFGFGG